MNEPRFRRPASLSPAKQDQLLGDVDPSVRIEIAHASAAALIGRRSADDVDPELAQRLVELIDAGELESLAEFWSASSPTTLPGTLWRLFELRQLVTTDPATSASHYTDGAGAAEVHDAVAGVAQPAGPQEIRRVLDALFSGAFMGDFGIALDRAEAFCRVLAVGTTHDADRAEPANPSRGGHLTKRADAVLRMAEDFNRSAALWRAGRLD